MIPLRDANPTRRRPVVTIAIIALCFLVFGLELAVGASGGDAALERFLRTFGVVPTEFLGALTHGRLLDPAVLPLISHQFLHGGWLHIGGNMLYLWIFGNNVEDRLGRLWFVLFFLVGGIVAALTQVVSDPTSTLPLVGASGAIAAILGAYIVLFPGSRVLSIVFLGFFFQLIEVPALLVLGLWFVLQLVDGLASVGIHETVGGVAVFAHIGGFLIGLAVGLIVRRLGPRTAALPVRVR